MMRRHGNAPPARQRSSLRISPAVFPQCTMPFEERVTLLARYAPDEPLGPPEGYAHWPDRVHALRERFPGYQPGARYREDMKFGRSPYDDPRLEPWVTILINHAKAKWSQAVQFENTNLQFADWILYYLGDSPLRWRGVGRLDEAAEFLREKFGMPRLPEPLSPNDPVAIGRIWKGSRKLSKSTK